MPQGEALSKEEEEARSSELIAKLLASDYGAGGWDAYSAGGHGDDDDFDGAGADDDDDYSEDYNGSGGKKTSAAGSTGAGARKGAKSSTNAAAKRKPTKVAVAPLASSIPGDNPPAATALEANGDNNGLVKGPWSTEEEARFLEGLELFGRSWPELAAHVKTRDAQTIRSKAQKHFIKLFRANQPLPAKVKESGEGYTLSGKPLDPHSASARPYLRLQEDPNAPPAPLKTKENMADDGPKRKKRKDSKGEKIAAESEAASADVSMNVSEETAEKDKLVVTVLAPTVRSDYSRERLRRNNIKPAGSYLSSLEQQDQHAMFKCRHYADPQSGNTSSQPFNVTVNPTVLLVCDIHAHLVAHEIIGFLAGTWNAQTGDLHVEEAFPCNSIVSGPDNVEMDPESEMTVRNAIFEKNLFVVGWYHSHPWFEPHPSRVDLENQSRYQSLFHDDESNKDPFVGLIVGTYDPRLPTSESVITTFHIPPSTIDQGEPKALRLSIQFDAAWSLSSATPALIAAIHFGASQQNKTRLQERWRADSDDSKLEKMIKSLRLRVYNWTASLGVNEPISLNSPFPDPASSSSEDAPPPTAAAIASIAAHLSQEAVVKLASEQEAVLSSLEKLILDLSL